MRKLIIKSNYKHTCNLCDNLSEVKFVMKDSKGKKKSYLCDDCLYDLLKDAMTQFEEEKDKKEEKDV